jgi:hypothetical protein
MLIAEDLLLLLTEDRTGKLLAPASQIDIALGGALLVELVLERRVDVTEGHGGQRKGRLVVTDASPTSDRLLDEALAILAAQQGKKPRAALAPLGKGLRQRLHARLAEQGLLRERHGRILGIIPTHRWPAGDTAHEDLVRAPLLEALRTGSTADPRAGAIVALLHALRAVGKVIDPAAAGVTSKELKASAERIADGDWASQAVREAIDQALAAVIAATSSSTSVVVSGGR